MGKVKNKQSDKRCYELGDHVGLRITEKSGATQEVVDFINKFKNGEFSAEIIECIKLRIDIEKNYTKAQIEELRRGETRASEITLIKNSQVEETKTKVNKTTTINEEILSKDIYTDTVKTPIVSFKSAEDMLFEDNIPISRIEDSQEINTIQVERKEATRPGIRALSSLKNIKEKIR